MHRPAIHREKPLLLLAALFLVSALCGEAAGEYGINQDIPQTVRYIQGNQQYLVKALYTITGFEETGSVGSGANLKKTQGKFVIVRYKVSNRSDIAVPSRILLDLILVNGMRSRWEQSPAAAGSAELVSGGFSKAQIIAGKEVEDVVIFDVPADLAGYHILLPGGTKVPAASLLAQAGQGATAKPETKSPGQKEARDTGKPVVTVVTNAATLRAEPSAGADAVAWPKKGASFEVIEKTRDSAGKSWYKVRMQGGKEGWLRDIVVRAGSRGPEEKKAPETAKPEEEARPEGKTQSPEKRTALVELNSVHLRSRPSLDAAPVTWAVKGTSFEVTGEHREENGRKWYKVKKAENGREYWVVAKVVRIQGEQKAAKPLQEEEKKAAVKKQEEAKAGPAAAEEKAPQKKEVREVRETKRTATISENVAHLRLRPSLESNPVTWAVKGTSFEVTGEHREENGRKWYKVKAGNGREYWIAAKAARVQSEQKAVPAEKAVSKGKDEMKPEPAPQEPAKTVIKEQAPSESRPGTAEKRTAMIIVGSAFLRSKPSFDAQKVMKVPKGTALEILEEFTGPNGKKWYKVRSPKGKENWIPDNVASISPFDLIEERFVESGLAVVQRPGTGEKKGTSEAAGERKPKKTITVTGEFAILRAEPTTEAKVVTWASKGTVFEVLDEFKEASGRKWYKVKSSNSTDCWVSDSMVTLSGAVFPSDTAKKGIEERPRKSKKTDQRREQMNAGALQDLLDKANTFYKEGKCEDFVALYEKAISIAARQKDPATEGTLHYNVAECYAMLNKFEDAVKHLDDAAGIARALKNTELEILSFLGKNRVLLFAGRKENAAEILKAVSERVDRDVFLNSAASDSLKALVSFQLSHIMLDAGDENNARERAAYALLVNRNFKMEDDIVALLKTLDASLYDELSGIDALLNQAWESYAKGDFRTMETASSRSLEGAKRLSYKRGVFSGNYYLGMALSANGDSKAAMDRALAAKDMAERGSDEMSLGMSYNLIGNIFRQERAYDRSLYYCTKYLEIVRKTGTREGEAIALNSIGNILMDKGEHRNALKYYEDSLLAALEAGSGKYLLAQGYLSLGRALKKLGEYSRAEENIALAKNTFKELGNEGGEVIGLWEMAGNYGLQGKYTSAIRILEENLARADNPGLKEDFIEDLLRYAEKSHDSERVAKYRKMIEGI